MTKIDVLLKLLKLCEPDFREFYKWEDCYGRPFPKDLVKQAITIKNARQRGRTTK